MDKQLVFQKLKEEINKQLQLAVDSVQVTLDVATHEENKPENKYDTRGLEASYLARAQSERVLDLKSVKVLIDGVKVRMFAPQDRIAITALIQLETSDKNLWILLLPKGGGQSVSFESITIKIITPESPLGAQLVGKIAGDSIEFKNTEYLISQVL